MDMGVWVRKFIAFPYQFHPFHSFPLVLFFPLYSPICVSVCLAKSAVLFFFLLSNDFISEISFHFPLPCVVIHFMLLNFLWLLLLMGAITVPLRRIILDLRKATKTPIKTKVKKMHLGYLLIIHFEKKNDVTLIENGKKNLNNKFFIKYFNNKCPLSSISKIR